MSDETLPDDRDLPPLADWPPKEILERRAAWQRARERRRRLHRRVFAAVLAAVVIVAGVVALGRRHHGPPVARARAPVGPPATMAWSVQTSLRRFTTVLTDPPGKGPVALAIPGDTNVDLPGAPPTVEAASTDQGLMVAAVQAALGRRIDHFLVTDEATFEALVDRLGPVDVQADVSFSADGLQLGPGAVRLSGAQAVAYLDQAVDTSDATARWEEVLTGVLAGRSAGWTGQLGLSDDDDPVRTLLSASRDAVVLELPTVPADQGGLLPDPDAAPRLLAAQFGAAEPLVRIIVLDGTSDPGSAARISSLLAPQGYRVVAEQPSTDPHTKITQIVAATDALVPKAEQVQTFMGVGMVYVGSEPTGIADITIVVGKDFAGA